MRYLELIAARPMVWVLFLVYMAATLWLSWLGHKKTTDLKSFSIGSGKMSPVIVGITLASSIASTATFVINPGFVYVHGLSALLHLGVAAGLGLVTGLYVMSTGFRRIGARSNALTLPQWVGQRFGSPRLAVFFAAVNLLSLTFVVLIVGGLSIVMQQTLGLSNVECLALVISFVFGYVLLGGTYAHAYTNTLQGIIMAVVAAIIVASGFHHFARGPAAFVDALAAADPNLVRGINPASPLFNSFFAIWVSGFVIGFALTCQPHIMTKALYVDSDRAVRRYLAVCVGVSLVFTGLLLVGFYARVMGLPPEAFVDPATGAFSQDRVMAVYLARTFDPLMLAVVTVAVLAAGMSTLDGVILALSTIAANDLFLGLLGHRLAHLAPETRARLAHRVGQGVLVAMGVAAFVIALHPPKLLGIFGQVGVYGIVAASTVPLLGGIVLPRLGARPAWVAALTGLGVHFALYALGTQRELGLSNPAVTATWALLASGVVILPAALRVRAAPSAQTSSASAC